LFFKIPDFFFVFAVADHQVVVFGCNNQVIDPIDDGYFPLRDVNEAIVGIVENNLGRVACVVVLVLFA